MLVLTRKLNEEIIIGQLGITVRVVDIRGGRVRLGVQAPPEIRIERAECQNAPHAAETLAEPTHS